MLSRPLRNSKDFLWHKKEPCYLISPPVNTTLHGYCFWLCEDSNVLSFLGWKFGVNVCGGTKPLQLHPPHYCCLQLTSIGLFHSARRGQPLAKWKLKRAAVTNWNYWKEKSRTGIVKLSPSGSQCTTRPLNLTSIAMNLTWEVILSLYSGNKHFN